MALAAKRGEIDPSTLKGAAKQMYNSMSEEQLHDFAATKRKGKPRYAKGQPRKVRKVRSA